MKKIFLFLFILIFASVAYYIITAIIQLNKPLTQEEKDIAAKEIAYYNAHHKEIGVPFTIDSIQYNFTKFEYIKKTDSMVLIVTVEITNLTNQPQILDSTTFSIVSEDNKKYYPHLRFPFTAFENKLQKLTLIYYLPELVLPYITSDVQLISKTDSTKNAFVRFYKTYRAEG
ncbi:MAG TPA: hypothetical protein PLP27_02645 [Crocinitomicaceae bacterium]|nr:hypothetical protein [Crocinitomicaceae bacterium]